MVKKLIFFGLVLIFLGVLLSFNISTAYFTTESSFPVSIVVPEDNYCIKNGITKLSDCMLVMENYASSPEEAKTYIESKGNATTNQTAPTITFQETTTEVSNTTNGVISTTAHFTLGKSYTFNSTTGMFTLTDYNNNDLSDEYINYYTCGSTTGTYRDCTTMYQIKAYEKVQSGTTTTYKVTKAIRYTYKVLESLDSEIGLYATNDDDGTSYFYRGAVENNYLSFAGFIWRIVRINGNGSIRLIYSGTSTNATGSATSIGTSQYNSKYFDPTYVGYKYHENFQLKEDTTQVNYINISDNNVYYYSDSYSFNEETRKFTLNGNKISGTWESANQEAIASYPYTCLSTAENGTCDFLLRLKGYNSPTSAKVNYITYSSVNYPSLLNNTSDSTIKGKIDSWYLTNIQNKQDSNGVSYASYLSDEVFCNDRTFTSGDGFSFSKTTIFSPYYRVLNQKQPSLSCSQDSDKFTVSPEKGNGKLTYPVGLITVDEAAFAGGVYLSANPEYYLYTGQIYWTMSPYYFTSSNASAHAWHVNSTGSLHAYWVSASYGVRPVVNLSADILITGGDGTKVNPYMVALS
ncbi:MAG TPA: hypothetical protein IAB56_03745 [Candidatus Scybalousia intestinigallinarum]|nr:hypothetical protein [Candidatus Scybalousia intestinigallinarum]